MDARTTTGTASDAMRKLLTLINAMVRDDLTWHQLDVVKRLATNP